MSSTTTQWIAEFIDHITAPLGNVTNAANGAAAAVDGIGNAAEGATQQVEKLSAIDLRAAAESIRDLTGQFDALMQPGLAFEVQMKEVQSITRMTDQDMAKLGDSAMALAEQFGGNAQSQLDSFGSIIARFGPEIAKDNEAMASMGNSVATLSKSMGGDAVGSMDALTTAMQQFGVDLSDPKAAAAEMARMMNVMAAAGNEGSSEVADTSAALKNAGVVAKNAGISFEETNAALQSLARGGKVGAEAGISLRNVLMKLAGEDILKAKAQGKLKALGVDFDIVSNKTLPFIDRLRELKKAEGDATLMTQIFGMENEAAARVLLNNIDFQGEVTQAIKGTNAATESAAIVMESTAEKMSRMNAWLDNLKIGFFGVVGSLTPFVSGLGTLAYTLVNMGAAVTGVKSLIGFVKSLSIATNIQTAAQWVLNTAMAANPIGASILALVALVAVITTCIAYYDKFGAALLLFMGPIGMVINGIMSIKRNWESVVQAFSSDGILGAIKQIGLVLLDAVLYPVQQLLELLAQIPGLSIAGVGAEQIAELRSRGGLVDPGATALDRQVASPKLYIPSLGEIVAKGISIPTAADIAAIKTNKIVGGGAGGGKRAGAGVQPGASGGGGGGGSKSIVMTVNNHFNGFKGTRELAEAVVGEINNRLSDGLAVV